MPISSICIQCPPKKNVHLQATFSLHEENGHNHRFLLGTMSTAHCASPWRHPAISKPVSSSFALFFPVFSAAFQWDSPHILSSLLYKNNNNTMQQEHWQKGDITWFGDNSPMDLVTGLSKVVAGCRWKSAPTSLSRLATLLGISLHIFT